jgi:hypothetical protein
MPDPQGTLDEYIDAYGDINRATMAFNEGVEEEERWHQMHLDTTAEEAQQTGLQGIPPTDFKNLLSQQVETLKRTKLSNNPMLTYGDVLENDRAVTLARHSLYKDFNDPRYSPELFWREMNRVNEAYNVAPDSWTPPPLEDITEQSLEETYEIPTREYLQRDRPAMELARSIRDIKQNWAIPEKLDLALRGVNPELRYPIEWSRGRVGAEAVITPERRAKAAEAGLELFEPVTGGGANLGHTFLRAKSPRLLLIRHLEFILDQTDPDPTREIKYSDPKSREKGLKVRDQRTRRIHKEKGMDPEKFMMYEPYWVNLPAIPQDILRDLPAFGMAALGELGMARLGQTLGRITQPLMERGRGRIYDTSTIYPAYKEGATKATRVAQAKLLGTAENIVESRGVVGKAAEIGAVSTGAATMAMLGDVTKLYANKLRGWNNVTFNEAVADAGGIALIAGMETAVADSAIRLLAVAYNGLRGVPLPDAILTKLRHDIELAKRAKMGIKMPAEEFSLKELKDTVSRLTKEILTEAPTQNQLKRLFYRARQKLGGAGEPPPAAFPVEYTPTLGVITNTIFARSVEDALLEATEISGAAWQGYVSLVEGDKEIIEAVYDAIMGLQREGVPMEWLMAKGTDDAITPASLARAFKRSADEDLQQQRILSDDPSLIPDEEAVGRGEVLRFEAAEAAAEGRGLKDPALDATPEAVMAPLQRRVPTEVSRAVPHDIPLLLRHRERYIQPFRDALATAREKYSHLRTGAGQTRTAMRDLLAMKDVGPDELLRLLETEDLEKFLDRAFVIRRNEAGEGLSTIKRLLGVDPRLASEGGTGQFVSPDFSLAELTQAQEVLNAIYGNYPVDLVSQGAKVLMDGVERQMDKLLDDGARTLMREQGDIPPSQKSITANKVIEFRERTGYGEDVAAGWTDLKNAIQTGDIGFLKELATIDPTRAAEFLMSSEPRKIPRLLAILRSQGDIEGLLALRQGPLAHIRRDVLDKNADAKTNLAAFKEYVRDHRNQLEKLYEIDISEADSMFRNFEDFTEKVIARQEGLQQAVTEIDATFGDDPFNVVKNFLDESQWAGRETYDFELKRVELKRLIDKDPDLQKMAHFVTLDWLDDILTVSGKDGREFDWNKLHQLLTQGIPSGPEGTVKLVHWIKPWFGEGAEQFITDLKQLDILAQRAYKTSGLNEQIIKGGTLGLAPEGGNVLQRLFRFIFPPLTKTGRRFTLGRKILSDRSMRNLTRALMDPELLRRFMRLRDFQISTGQMVRLLTALDAIQASDWVWESEGVEDRAYIEQSRPLVMKELIDETWNLGDIPSDVAGYRQKTAQALREAPEAAKGLSMSAFNSLIDWIDKNYDKEGVSTPEDIAAEEERRLIEEATQEATGTDG